uniref:Uncharacterized protein n=1 Tax=Alexandrium andersonii TaxID=327968 RepID=A0A7S2E0W2_9DINO|mmetsp:Transcript_62941/g.141544  ORF Transcript_62941/g.141544 Transcript_62941/m.141544 type:complete len:102 (+) Transcript_62941:3-308(+)
MPMILSDAGYEYAVVEQNPTCTSKRGVAYTCAQYLAESVCTCAQCFGGSDEDAGGKFLLGYTEYASDVAFAMRDLMESSDLGKDTCGGSCAYSRRDFRGQQ